MVMQEWRGCEGCRGQVGERGYGTGAAQGFISRCASLVMLSPVGYVCPTVTTLGYSGIVVTHGVILRKVLLWMYVEAAAVAIQQRRRSACSRLTFVLTVRVLSKLRVKVFLRIQP